MPGRRVRYFPAGTDVDDLMYRRRVEVLAAQPAQPAPQKVASSKAATEGMGGCPGVCQKETTAHTTQQAPLQCLTVTEQHPIKQAGRYTLAWCMATNACYIPMLDPSYRGDVIHELAICGLPAFSELKDYVYRQPRSIWFRDSAGNTPLMLACASHGQSYPVVKFLTDKCSAKLIQAQNVEGLTALHFAVLSDNPDVVRLLLKRRAIVDAGSIECDGKKYGLTPLHLTLIDHSAPENRATGCFNLLLDSGADISIEMVESSALSDHASIQFECNCGGCWSSNIDFYFVVPSLIRVNYVLLPTANTYYDYMQTSLGKAFNTAVRTNNLWQVKALWRRFPSIDINYKDGYMRSPLFHAIENGNLYMLNFLLSKGADVNATFPFQKGNSLLSMLMSYNRETATTIWCGWCKQPVSSAESNFNIFVDALLDHPELDISVKNALGESALSIAVSEGHLYACKKLLQKGANPLDVNGDGQCLLTLACNIENEHLRAQVLALLLTTGLGHQLCQQPFTSSTASALWTMYQNRDSQTLNALFDAGGVDTRNLQEMLSMTTNELHLVWGEDAEHFNHFRASLLALKSKPRPLKEMCLLYFSDKAGVGSSAERQKTLRSFDPDEDGAVWHLMVDLLKRYGLL